MTDSHSTEEGNRIDCTPDDQRYAMCVARIMLKSTQGSLALDPLPEPWCTLAEVGLEARDSGKSPAAAIELAIDSLDGHSRTVREELYMAAELIRSEPAADQAAPMASLPLIPALPKEAQLPEDLGRDASPWLDAYIDFSRKWSPRAYDDFHEACGIWVLSTVAARRVELDLGKKRYPTLFILLAARTSLYAKTTTAEIAIDTLRAADLDFLLAADCSTPQKFIQDLTLRLTSEYDQLPAPYQDRLRKRLAFAGQRGWFYEEFGQQMHAMNRRDGPMAEFRGIIRRFDDCAERYEYATIGRGTDIVERPYLALLGNLTPADLRPFAKHGATMWNDGFWARFVLVTPPSKERKRGRFPSGERVVPRKLSEPLRKWHERLGVPSVSISEATGEDGEPKGRKTIDCETLRPSQCTLGAEVAEAFYRYHDALLDIIEQNEMTDFDGNYARFAEKALRIAMLLASLENDGRIEMRHWARGQAIAERWRAGMHALYDQVNEPEPSETERMEANVMRQLNQHKRLTAAQVANNVRGIDSQQANAMLQGLARMGVVITEQTKRTTYYKLHEEDA